MNILVIGGLSEIGFKLSCNLSHEHSVTIIDNCTMCYKLYDIIPENIIYYKFDVNSSNNNKMLENIVVENDIVYILINEFNSELLEFFKENNITFKFKTDLNLEKIYEEYEKHR